MSASIVKEPTAAEKSELNTFYQDPEAWHFVTERSEIECREFLVRLCVLLEFAELHAHEDADAARLKSVVRRLLV